jgi:dipeptidyl aminopeptidase/acylaminoacyl peptidase
MHIDSSKGERIDSWKDISAYLGRDVSTVIRWEKERGLPVHRIPGGQRKGVFAYRHELDQWMAGLRNTNGADASLLTSAEPPTLSTAIEKKTTESTETVKVGLWHRLWRPGWRQIFYTATGFLGALVLLSSYGHLDSWLKLRSPQLVGQHQLTANGREKREILTNGKTIFFAQEQNGWFALAEMPMDGGAIRILWNPDENATPASISPNGNQLLALCGTGVEEERELWIVPRFAGAPRLVPDVKAHSAAWAPDGKTIAFASGTELYLTSANQQTPTNIGAFATVPRALYWSRDGRYLNFILDGLFAGKGVSWGQISIDATKTITMRPLPLSMYGSLNWSPVGGDNTMAAWRTELDLKDTQVWLVRFGTGWWQPSVQVAPISFVEGELYGVEFVPEQSRLVSLSMPRERTAFVRFDLHSQTFRQILPGTSGAYLNYSNDGQWVTYVSSHDEALWLSRADGSSARQLTFAPDAVELPRWSPDGRLIAYMLYRTGRPWRIQILDVATGKSWEASEGNDSQGAPTWSPDGRYISYGGVNCEATRTCAIHRIDLATRKVQTLPDSDGLFTARWSPDGRFIAALNLEQHKLMLFDVKSQTWRKLADGINGTDLGWAFDSNDIYVDIPGGARIARIRIADGHEETLVDLRTQDDFNLAEVGDLQFSVAPDEAVILHRTIHSPEIYSFDVRVH